MYRKKKSEKKFNYWMFTMERWRCSVNNKNKRRISYNNNLCSKDMSSSIIMRERCRDMNEAKDYLVNTSKTIRMSSRIQNKEMPSVINRTMKNGSCLFMLLISLCLLTTVQSAALCPNECECNDETLVVSCVGALGVIPIALNPSTQRLILKDSHIRSVDAAAFQFYGDIKYVDLSSNHLMAIPDNSFSAQKVLRELNFKNNKISALTTKTFTGLVSLTILNLHKNYLETLSNGLFTSLTKLEELDLGQNQIRTVEPGAFQKLGNLKVLYLDDNKLGAIPSPALAPLNALVELHIGLNSFTTLPDDGFRGLERLAVLDIMNAGLDNISDNSFRGLTSLRTLKLSGNKLREVPTKQLSILTRLEELTLGQNSFTMLRSGAFQGLSNLKNLDISGAKLLTTLERGTFSDNGNLESLILKSNRRFMTIEEGALVGLPNLRHLILRENAFTTFSESLVAWEDLRRLDLSENPLICDCSLLWLSSVLVPRNSSPVICAEPQELRGKQLKNMEPDVLGCAFADPKRQALLLTICIGGLAFFAGVSLILYYRCRQRVRDALKDYKWKNRAISRKEHEYQKTFSDDEYIVRAAHGQQQQPQQQQQIHQNHLQLHHNQLQHIQQPHQYHHHHHLHHNNQQYHQQVNSGIKQIPVTEL